MPVYFFTFRNLTGAQRAAVALDRAGISVGLMRTPTKISRNGCGYCLRVYYDKERAKQVLSASRIAWQRVYLQRTDGSWGEQTDDVF